MKLSTAEQALLRVGKAPNKTLKLFDEAIHWTTATSRTLADLEQQSCADRLLLAEHFHAAGNKLIRSRPAQHRSAISRYYYSMYHSIRAVVYFDHRGDDFQEHSSLPAKLPTDFPASAIWRNNLKDARGYRNDADYDPYPLDAQAWKAEALVLKSQSSQLVSIARQYLRQKGCAHV